MPMSNSCSSCGSLLRSSLSKSKMAVLISQPKLSTKKTFKFRSKYHLICNLLISLATRSSFVLLRAIKKYLKCLLRCCGIAETLCAAQGVQNNKIIAKFSALT